MRLQMYSKVIAALLVTSCLVGCTGPEQTVTTPETTLPLQTEATLPSVENSTPRQIVEAYAQMKGIPVESWPNHIIAMIGKNPEMIQYVLDYPFEYGKVHEIDMTEFAGTERVPLFIQWDKRWGYLRYGADLVGLTGCGPTCLSMAAYYLTQDPNMSPDKIVKFAIENKYLINGGGSSWQIVTEGAPKLGLEVKTLILSEYQLKKALEEGHPVICNMGPGIFTETGHYVVFVGAEDGKFRINDPNSPEKSGKLWAFSDFKDQVRNWWAISLPES